MTEVKITLDGDRAEISNDGETYVLSHVHSPLVCVGKRCTLHSPTDHNFRARELLWNPVDGLFYRLCAHDKPVLDPDQFDYLMDNELEIHCCGFTKRRGPWVQCQTCQDIIRSNYRHDFVSCKCGATYVDGGEWYTRIGGPGVIVTPEQRREILDTQ